MRGFWHIIEAVIAGIMIMLFLVTITTNVLVEPPPKDLSKEAFRLVHGLEKQNLLRDPADSQDYAEIDGHLRFYAFNHTVEVCDYAGSCQGLKPDVKNRWVGTYILAGEDSYKPMEVRVYLFQVDDT